FTPDLVDLLQIVGELDPVDDDPALLVFFQPVDTADHGGLSRPRRSANDDAFAAHDLQVDVAEHVEIAIPFVHGDDLDRDVRVRHAQFRAVDLDFLSGGNVLGSHFHPRYRL